MAEQHSQTGVGASGAAVPHAATIPWSSTTEGEFLIAAMLESATALPDCGPGFTQEALGRFLRAMTVPADPSRAQLDADPSRAQLLSDSGPGFTQEALGQFLRSTTVPADPASGRLKPPCAHTHSGPEPPGGLTCRPAWGDGSRTDASRRPSILQGSFRTALRLLRPTPYTHPPFCPPPSRLGRLHLTTNLRRGGGARRLSASLHLTGGKASHARPRSAPPEGHAALCFLGGQESASAPPTPILAHAYWLKLIKYD